MTIQLTRLIPKPLKAKLDNYLSKRYVKYSVCRQYSINLLSKGRFENKVAFVTGGSGAIGRAICFRLAAEGAIVCVGGKTEMKIKAVVDEIIKSGGSAAGFIIDVTSEQSISDSINKAIEKYGRMDILVTCAGGSAREISKNIADQEAAVIDSVLDINLRGSMLCAKEAAKHMIKNKSGKIITLSSIVGLQGKKGFTDYAASKAGLFGFIKSLAIELGEYGINVNCVSPGIINRDSITLSQMETLTKKNCINSIGKPEDISNMVAFLASDEASFITGQNFIVDGGRSLGLKGD